MMWNFFVLFFYEASLEITFSIVIGVGYIWAYDEADPAIYADQDPLGHNALTRKVHRTSVYVFFVMLCFGMMTVIVLMTRSEATLERIEP